MFVSSLACKQVNQVKSSQMSEMDKWLGEARELKASKDRRVTFSFKPVPASCSDDGDDDRGPGIACSVVIPYTHTQACIMVKELKNIPQVKLPGYIVKGIDPTHSTITFIVFDERSSGGGGGHEDNLKQMCIEIWKRAAHNAASLLEAAKREFDTLADVRSL